MNASLSPWLTAPFLALVAGLIALLPAGADIPDQKAPLRAVPATPEISGIYQVVSSNDPMFSLGDGSEWFLDFGKAGRTGGKVAVSRRQNPRVQVRVHVWQVFPEHGRLLIGNQFHEGARRAVAKAVWKVSSRHGDVILERNGRRVVLRRPAPDVY